VHLPLARTAVDAAAHRRAEPGLVAALWADSATRVLVVHEGRLAMADDEHLDLRAPADLPGLAPQDGPGAVWAFLGEDADHAYLGALLVDLPPEVPSLEGVPARGVAWSRARWGSLREVGHALSDRDAGLATTAVALAEWHLRNPRCSRCGAPTRADHAGWLHRCPQDGAEDYPRTDPAVIMAVTDDAGRILLGHAHHWPARRFSTLAGFVEPGESAEEAVRREVAEETGVVVGEVAYVGSQPWPFPASLMLAFRARATTVDLRVDDRELGEARWFTRAELGAAVRAGEVLLPMRSSVALSLIEEWYGAPLVPRTGPAASAASTASPPPR